MCVCGISVFVCVRDECVRDECVCISVVCWG